MLPVRPFDWAYARQVIQYTIVRNHQAYLSHRKTKIDHLNKKWKGIIIKME